MKQRAIWNLVQLSAAQKEEMQMSIACIALHTLCCGGNILPHSLTATQSPHWPAPKMSSAFPSPMPNSYIRGCPNK